MAQADRSRLRFIAGVHLSRLLWDHRSTEKGLVPASAIISYAQEYEAAGFDAFFYADFLGLDRTNLSRIQSVPYEPVTLLSAIAASTSRIGLLGTASTLFEQPYNLARKFASLDHISQGRVGWNAVTSFNGEKNFGISSIPSPAERYAIGGEFIDVAKKLWGSWDADAVITDKNDRRYVDTAKIHDINHSGPHFSVKEGLDIPRSPQVQPVIFQAGASPEGIEFAGRYAEGVFAASPDIEHGKIFYRAIKQAAVQNGRHPHSIKVFPGIRTFIGHTQAEAQAKYDFDVDDYAISHTINTIAYEWPEIDLSGLDIDKPIPADRFPDLDTINASNRRRSRILILIDYATQPGRTFADLVRFVYRSYGHFTVVGTPVEIADVITRWFEEEAADGFILQESADSFELFVSEVLPILKERGIWFPPTEQTLRDNLGVGHLS